ncbi:hypothetical protein Ari01nite_64990 [Paractinoplanes rishiriensis]|uniref:Uncharacterized protein n=1 Tax=Paractinoplanes rishiriensis TaxID=1050105 RepID=A0A919K5B9_9ACTN|nr:hypothetical protein Ari01nite_64990 [Actinoplanes rishiriensis]
MTSNYQPSMLDLMAGPTPTLEPLAAGIKRHVLTAGAWVDVLPGWLHGSDEVFETLLGIDWRADRRQMYDTVVDVPRLLRWYDQDEQLPHPALTEAREALTAHYADELREPFITAGMCLYRDGQDSVAWHGDTIGRSAARPTTTPWSPSCPSAPRAICRCGRARAGMRRCASHRATAT